MAYDVSKKPGEWVRARSERESVVVLVLFVAAFAALGLATAALVMGEKIAATLLIVASILVMKLFLADQIEVALRWLKGSNAECAVGADLDDLKYEGYVVMHDIEQMGEGNIDHLVSGPTGVFLVETKFGWYQDVALKKVKRQSARVHDELGVWVTPVICRARSEKAPYRHSGVWIVARTDLVGWIRGQRGRRVEFERLAQFADRLQ